MKKSYTLYDLPAEERPRERLMKFGPEALSTTELIALLLGMGVSGEPVMVTAQKLLLHFGSLNVNDFIRQFHALGKERFESMILRAPLVDVFTHQEKRAAILKQAWPENPLLPELVATIQEFKQLLYNQK